MYTDRELTFSEFQSLTTGTQVSTDKYNAGVSGIDINDKNLRSRRQR